MKRSHCQTRCLKYEGTLREDGERDWVMKNEQGSDDTREVDDKSEWG